MSQTTNQYRVPISVADKLESVRARSWKVRLRTALLVGTAVLLGAMGVAMLIDRLATVYSPGWRSVLTLSALTACGATLISWIVAAKKHVTRTERVAAEVDKQLPTLNERWTTVSQLSKDGEKRHIHPAMYRQVAHEASTYSPQVDPERVVSTTSLRRAALACSGLAALLVLAAVLDWQRAPVLLERFWLPLANISATTIEETQTTQVVARGESLEISAQLAGVPVEEAQLLLQPTGGQERHVRLIPKGENADQLEHRIRTVKEPMRYRLRAGDGQTVWHEIEVADRPRLARATLKITPPDYTQSEPTELKKIPPRTSALAGSKLEFTFRPEAAVSELNLDFSPGESLQLTADDEGNYRWETTIEDSFSLTPLLTEEHGLSNARPRQFEIRAVPDKPPVVRILTPNQEMAVRPNEKVPVTFEATDDVRIGSAELVVYDETNRAGREPRILDTIPIPLGKQEGARKVRAGVELDLSKYETVNGAELSFAVRVREDRSLARQEPPAMEQVAGAENAPAELSAGEDALAAAAEPDQGETTIVDAETQTDPSPAANGSPQQPQTGEMASASSGEPVADAAPAGGQAAGTNPATANQGASVDQVAASEAPDTAAQAASEDETPNTGESLAATESSNDTDAPASVDEDAAPVAGDGGLSPLAQALADALPEGLRDMATEMGEAEGSNAGGEARPGAAGNPSDAASAQPGEQLAAETASESPADEDSLADTAKSSVAESDAATAAQLANEENQETTTDRQRLMTADLNAPEYGGRGAPSPPPAAENALADGAANSPGGSQPEPGQPQDSEMAAEENRDPGATGTPGATPGATNNAAASGNQSPAVNNEQSMADANQPSQSSASPGQQNQPNMSPDGQQNQPNESSMAQNGGQQDSRNSSKSSQQAGGQSGSTPPRAQTNMAQLDVEQGTQSSTSNRMRLKIDEYAGSLAGQERARVEMAVAPMLMKMDELLESAEKLSRSVLDEIDGGTSWQGKHTRDVDSAGQRIAECLEVIEELEVATHDTPYAFVGLQMLNIGKTQVQPARRDFWKTLQTNGDSRVAATRSGWQHTVRAREMLLDLTSRFENTRREYALAEAVEEIKKMYQVFVENSMALLSEDSDEGGNRYRRKRVEFDLDEEYLARLKEVIEMRNRMRAELARILADDPRLLRRFLDAQKNRTQVIRHELDRLVEGQQELNREVLAWKDAPEEERPELRELYMQRHAEDSQELAVDAALLQDKFETWLPLAENASNRDVQAAGELLQHVATATRELGSDAELLIEQNQRAKIRRPAGQTEEADATEVPVDTEPTVSLEQITSGAQQFKEELVSLEVTLRQLGLSQERPEMASFAANRLIETRQLVTKTEEWMRKMNYHQAGNYHNAAEVSQYQLALRTDAIAGKLADLEQQMENLLQRNDNKLPESIATQARELLASLDEQAAPNQLSAVYALRRDQIPRAVARQESALAALEQAAKAYDDMVEAAIKELDKLPVQDPIASLLNDPTLDELLAELEQEFLVQDLLGIPRRPSNLQIFGDFSRSGGDNALMTGGGRRQMLLNQLMQRQRLRQRRLDQAYRRAIARALNEKDLLANIGELQLAQETVAWNVLLSQLGEDMNQDADKAAPERYRRAIEQYFRQISRPERQSQ